MNRIYSFIAKVLGAKKIALPAIDDNSHDGLLSCGCDCDYNCDWDLHLEDPSNNGGRVLPSAIKPQGYSRFFCDSLFFMRCCYVDVAYNGYRVLQKNVIFSNREASDS